MLILLTLCPFLVSADVVSTTDELETIYATESAQPDLQFQGRLSGRLEKLMFQQAKYLISTLRPWEKDQNALLLTDGSSAEHGIRPNAHTAFGLAIMYRCIPHKNYPKGLSPDECRDRAIDVLRFVLPTHNAGGMTCNNQKQWKDQWQSALWANSAGKACWLLWDDLPDELKFLAARMITDEAERFVGKTPPARIDHDTKAEENAWNSEIISLAYNMFPNHPQNEEWKETAIRWAISSFARPADLESEDIYDGKPLREWLTGANIYDDYTLENHSRVHPDYMNTFNILLHQIPVYEWAGNEPPQALTLNCRGIYANLKKLFCPDAGYLYPNGQDWRIHRNADWLRTHSGQMTLFNDPQAARLFRVCLETVEKMARRNPDGGVYYPGEYFFPSTQHSFFEGCSKSYYLLRSRGEGPKPVSEKQLWKDLSGAYVFESGKFAIMRTSRSITSFSWGKAVMGMALPLQKDLLVSPFERSLIGSAMIGEKRLKDVVLRRVEIAKIPGAFGITGIIERGNGTLEQRFGFLALDDDRSVYIDTIRAVTATDVTALELGAVSILNDADWCFHNGERTMYHEDGKCVFTSKGDDETPVHLKSRWFNIDNELGIVCLRSAGQRYLPWHRPWRGRTRQLFSLNHTEIEDKEYLGENIAETAIVFYPGKGRRFTRKAATRCKIGRDHNSGDYVIRLEDGREITIDLVDLKMEID